MKIKLYNKEYILTKDYIDIYGWSHCYLCKNISVCYHDLEELLEFNWHDRGFSGFFFSSKKCEEIDIMQFAQYLVKSLIENPNKTINAKDIIESIIDPKILILL